MQNQLPPSPPSPIPERAAGVRRRISYDIQIGQHPRGKAGGSLSLEQASIYATDGGRDPAVKAWAVKELHRAGRPATAQRIARCLWQAIREQTIAIDDPVWTEYMQPAACTLVGCEGLPVQAGDCDDLAIALSAALCSVGIVSALVGQSLTTDVIDHQTVAFYDSRRWIYCDPFMRELDFGEHAPASFERWLLIPGGSVLYEGSPPDVTTIVPNVSEASEPASVLVQTAGTGLRLGLPAGANTVHAKGTKIMQAQDPTNAAQEDSIRKTLLTALDGARRQLDEMDRDARILRTLQELRGKAKPGGVFDTQTQQAQFHTLQDAASVVNLWGQQVENKTRAVGTTGQDYVIGGHAGEPTIELGDGGTVLVSMDGHTASDVTFATWSTSAPDPGGVIVLAAQATPHAGQMSTGRQSFGGSVVSRAGTGNPWLIGTGIVVGGGVAIAGIIEGSSVVRRWLAKKETDSTQEWESGYQKQLQTQGVAPDAAATAARKASSEQKAQAVALEDARAKGNTVSSAAAQATSITSTVLWGAAALLALGVVATVAIPSVRSYVTKKVGV